MYIQTQSQSYPKETFLSYFTLNRRNPMKHSYQTTTPVVFHGDAQCDCRRALWRRIILDMDRQIQETEPFALRPVRFCLFFIFILYVSHFLKTCCYHIPLPLLSHDSIPNFFIHLFVISCNLCQFPTHNPPSHIQQSVRTSSAKLPWS